MYRKILVSTDGSELSIRAVKEAARLAGAVGASLLVLHVRSPLEIPHHVAGGALSRLGEDKISEEIKIEEQALLQAAKDAATSAGVVPEVAFIAVFFPTRPSPRWLTSRNVTSLSWEPESARDYPGFSCIAKRGKC